MNPCIQPFSIDAWLCLGRLIADAAWPIAALLFVFAFRKQIQEIIPRLKRLPGGAEIADQHQQQPQGDILSALPTPGPGVTNQGVYGIHATVREEFGGEIEREIEPLGVADRIERLRTNLILARRFAIYMIVLRSIFGSQVELLNRTVQAYGLANAETIEDIYQVYVARGGNMPKPNWLRYLLNHLLMTGDEREARITDRGRDFLVWMTAAFGDNSTSLPL